MRAPKVQLYGARPPMRVPKAQSYGAHPSPHDGAGTFTSHCIFGNWIPIPIIIIHIM